MPSDIDVWRMITSYSPDNEFSAAAYLAWVTEAEKAYEGNDVLRQAFRVYYENKWRRAAAYIDKEQPETVESLDWNAFTKNYYSDKENKITFLDLYDQFNNVADPALQAITLESLNGWIDSWTNIYVRDNVEKDKEGARVHYAAQLVRAD